MPFDTAFRSPSPEVEVLRSAMRYIREPEWWCQHSFSKDKHLRNGCVLYQHCAVGAIEEVCPRGFGNRRVVEKVFEALAAEIDVPGNLYHQISFFLYTLFWPWRRSINRHKVIWFNDLRQTRHADVMHMFTRAMERLEMQTLMSVR